MRSNEPSASIPIVAIVDDDDDFRSLLEDYLNAKGWASRAFREASMFIETFNQDPCRFMMVIGDVNMPGFVELKVPARVKLVAPQVQVILISAPPHDTFNLANRTGDADLILYKPFHLKRIHEHIQNWRKGGNGKGAA